MSNFGSEGFGTIEPGNGTLEEQIVFTGVTQNANGTATLTGVKNVTFLYPYTQTSGLLKTHAGATTFVISNTSGFYDRLTSKDDDETISGTWTFTAPNYPQIDVAATLPTLNAQFATKQYVDGVAVAGAPNANPTTKGIVQIATQADTDARTLIGSTSAYLAVTPADLRSTLLSDYVLDTSTSPNVIKIAPSPVITSYQTGQMFSFKLANTNTSPTVSVNVNGLGAKNVSILNGGFSPAAKDLVAGGMIVVEYDGTNFQVQSPTSQLQPSGAITMYGGSTAPGGWLLCNGSPVSRTTYANLFAVVGTSFGIGDGVTTFNIPALGGNFVAGPSAYLSSTIGATGGAATTSFTSNITGLSFSRTGSGQFVAANDSTNPFNINQTTISIIPPYMILNYIIKV